MTSQRDWQLKRLGIIQWDLRRPIALQGEITISLPANVRLIMIADELPALNEVLISDVLRALKISANQVLQLTPNHVEMLTPGSYCNSWRLGSSTREVIKLKGSQLISPVLKELQINPDAKIALWQQICKHAHNFFPS